MRPTTLADAAVNLAYLVQTSPREAARAVARIGSAERDVIIVALAAMVDIDRTVRELTDRTRRPDITAALIDAARTASYRPAWTAYQYGDRDPDVVTKAKAYQRATRREQLCPGSV